MLVFLFTGKSRGAEYARPVPWDQPEEWTVPMQLPITEQVAQWFEANGKLEYDSMLNGKYNCMRFFEQFGKWPVPFDADVVLLQNAVFNDPLPDNL